MMQVVQQLRNTHRTELVIATDPEGNRARREGQDPSHQCWVKGRCQKVNVPRTWHCPHASHQACDIGMVLVESENHGRVGARRNTQDAILGTLMNYRKELQRGAEGFQLAPVDGNEHATGP